MGVSILFSIFMGVVILFDFLLILSSNEMNDFLSSLLLFFSLFFSSFSSSIGVISLLFFSWKTSLEFDLVTPLLKR